MNLERRSSPTKHQPQPKARFSFIAPIECPLRVLRPMAFSWSSAKRNSRSSARPGTSTPRPRLAARRTRDARRLRDSRKVETAGFYSAGLGVLPAPARRELCPGYPHVDRLGDHAGLALLVYECDERSAGMLSGGVGLLSPDLGFLQLVKI